MKVAALVLLLAAAGCVAAQNGTMSKSFSKPSMDVTLDIAGMHRNISSGVTDVITQVHSALTKPGNTSTEGCECKEECEEKKKTFCDVKEGEEEECEDVEVVDEVMVCKEKCYTISAGAHIINVPTLDFSHLTKGRRLSQAVAVSKVSKAGVSVTVAKGAAGNGTDAAAAGAVAGKAAGEDKKVCREICNRHPRTTTEKKCEMVPTKEFVNCEERVLAKKCKNVCKCGDRTVITSMAPDFSAALSNMTLTVPNKVEVAQGAMQMAHALMASKGSSGNTTA